MDQVVLNAFSVYSEGFTCGSCFVFVYISTVMFYTVSPKKHVTTFSTITLTISVRLQ